MQVLIVSSIAVNQREGVLKGLWMFFHALRDVKVAGLAHQYKRTFEQSKLGLLNKVVPLDATYICVNKQT